MVANATKIGLKKSIEAQQPTKPVAQPPSQPKQEMETPAAEPQPSMVALKPDPAPPLPGATKPA